MYKIYPLFVFAALILNHSSYVTAAEEKLSVEDSSTTELQLATATRKGWVPPGFEDLNEPQTMEVDVWYGGYYLTSALARFTFEELRFLTPQAITDQIPTLNDAERMQSLLSEGMPTNSGLVCRSEFEIDCGALQAEDIGIIFDRTNFRASLFIASENLSVADSQTSRYLPDSSAALSAYSQSGLNFSGNSDQTLAFNLSNDTQIALAESRLVLRSNWTDEEGFVFDSLGLQREHRGKKLSAGLIRSDSPGFEFVNTEHFMGVSLESSLTTRTDLDQSNGNDILLFLSSRSLVEVYRDNRLLYSSYYDVGNQLLDTSSLPSGSYNIEIRTTDLSGNTNIDTRFYSKSARLAPTDQGLYFFQAGSLVESGRGDLLPEQLNNFVRAGYRKRLSASMGAGLALSATEDSRLLELSVFKQGQNFEFSSGLAYEDDSTLGISAELRLNYEFIDLDLSTRQILNSAQPSQSAALRQLADSQTEYRANLRFRSKIGMWNLFYRDSNREATSNPLLAADIDLAIEAVYVESFNRSNRNYGMRWNYNGMKFRGGQLRASAELSRNNDATLFVLGLTYNFGSRQRQYSIAPRMTAGTDEDGNSYSRLEGSSSTNWRMGNAEQHRLNLRAQRQGQSIIEANYQNTASSAANDITARYDFSAKQLSYNGSLRSTIATTRTSSAFGNSQNGQSAFLINIDAAEDDSSEYEVLVNGSPKGKTQPGRTLLVPVAPYETYNVKLVSKGESLINLKENNFVKTVYPGNVIALEWSAQTVKVGYGRILDAAGQPFSNAVVSTSGGISMSDQYGYFQLEVTEDTSSFDVRRGDDTCQVNFTQDNAQKMVVPLGDLVCR
jgi:Mat/Ecp fimbriae outer membrane usher protein